MNKYISLSKNDLYSFIIILPLVLLYEVLGYINNFESMIITNSRLDTTIPGQNNYKSNSIFDRIEKTKSDSRSGLLFSRKMEWQSMPRLSCTQFSFASGIGFELSRVRNQIKLRRIQCETAIMWNEVINGNAWFERSGWPPRLSDGSIWHLPRGRWCWFYSRIN